MGVSRAKARERGPSPRVRWGALGHSAGLWGEREGRAGAESLWGGLSAGRRRLPLYSLPVAGIPFLLPQGAMTEMTERVVLVPRSPQER